RREDSRLKRDLIRNNDRIFIGHLDVRDGPPASDAAWLGFQFQRVGLGGDRGSVPFSWRAYISDLQRGVVILFDRAWIFATCLVGIKRRGRMVRAAVETFSRRDPKRIRARSVVRIVEVYGQSFGQPDGRRMVWDGDGARLRAVVRV